jgi:hypothetical protein
VEGLPEGAKPILSLQLSSPVEEATLSEIYDPLNADPAPEGSIATFEGVETTMATLVATAKDADIPLGSSAPHELAPLCLFDAMEVKEQYVSEVAVAIVAEGMDTATAEVAEIVEASEEEGKPDTPSEEKVADAEVVSEANEEEAKKPATEEPPAAESETKLEPQEAAAVPLLPICTITLRVTYKPSPKDQREELYELLNKASQRKAAALENLRKISTAMARSGESASPSKGGSSTAMTKPTVKSGFLNKKKKEKEPTKIEKIYARTIGPNSMLMKVYGKTIAAKNFLIFFGAVGFFHFKGQLLALPPPA